MARAEYYVLRDGARWKIHHEGKDYHYLSREAALFLYAGTTAARRAGIDPTGQPRRVGVVCATRTAGLSALTPVSPGQLQVHANVVVRFRIEPK